MLAAYLWACSSKRALTSGTGCTGNKFTSRIGERIRPKLTVKAHAKAFPAWRSSRGRRRLLCVAADNMWDCFYVLSCNDIGPGTLYLELTVSGKQGSSPEKYASLGKSWEKGTSWISRGKPLSW